MCTGVAPRKILRSHWTSWDGRFLVGIISAMGVRATRKQELKQEREDGGKATSQCCWSNDCTNQCVGAPHRPIWEARCSSCHGRWSRRRVSVKLISFCGQLSSRQSVWATVAQQRQKLSKRAGCRVEEDEGPLGLYQEPPSLTVTCLVVTTFRERGLLL